MDDLVLDAEDAGIEPKVDITDHGPCSKSLTITIPADTVDERLEVSLGTVAAEANLPGFRKGKIPRRIVERRFGDAIRQEAQGQLMSDAYTKAVESNELQIIGEPTFEQTDEPIRMESGKELTFTVQVEVVPKFELPDLEGVPVVKPIMEIGDEHVNSELERTRYRLGTPEKIQGPFEHLDRMLGHVEIRLNGSDEIFFENDQAVSVVPGKDDEGRGQFLGLMIEGLDKILMGHKVGETLEFETTGPESHEREELRNAKIAIKYDVQDAERVTPLELSDLVTRLGLDSEEGLREQVRMSLEHRRDGEQRSAEREQVYEWLLDQIQFESPPKMAEAQVARFIESQRMELASRGMEDDEIETQLAKIRDAGEETTRNRIRLHFILARISSHFEISVNEQEINGRIAEIAMSQGMRPDQVRAELAKNNRINEIANQIREHKAADRIVDTAKVTEMPAEEWNKLVDEKAAAKSGSGKSAAKKTSSKKSTSKKSSAKKSSTKKASTKKSSSKKTSSKKSD